MVGLSGAMSAREQDHALSDPGNVRRVIVSTAVAESSLTVPGVRLVVDSGLSREPRLDRGRGMTGLVTVRESRASAVQRAGRAARLGPGGSSALPACPGLGGHECRPYPRGRPRRPCGVPVVFGGVGIPSWRRMALPTPLPQDRVAAAEEELRDLGAVDAEGRITARGRHLATFPLDPRLARALTDGAAIIGSRRCAEIAPCLAGRRPGRPRWAMASTAIGATPRGRDVAPRS